MAKACAVRTMYPDVFDAVGAHVAVVDHEGKIIAVNHAWQKFALENGAISLQKVDGGVNYLDVCRDAVLERSADAELALIGIEKVRRGLEPSFEMDYPCNAPDHRRWFRMQVKPLQSPSGHLVIAHFDISRPTATESVAG